MTVSLCVWERASSGPFWKHYHARTFYWFLNKPLRGFMKTTPVIQWTDRSAGKQIQHAFIFSAELTPRHGGCEMKMMKPAWFVNVSAACKSGHHLTINGMPLGISIYADCLCGKGFGWSAAGRRLPLCSFLLQENLSGMWVAIHDAVFQRTDKLNSLPHY